jgi:hypothetical protein
VLHQRQGHTWGVLTTLCDLAESALVLGDPRQAVRIYAATNRLERLGGVVSSTGDPGGYDQSEIERNLATARETLGDSEFGAQWSTGAAMTIAQAVGDALQTWPVEETF